MTLGAAGAGAALALVHGLHPGDRDGVALVDQVGGQRLRRGHRLGPRVAAVGQLAAAVCTVKSAGCTSVEVVPATGNDTGTPGRTRGL